MSWEGYQSVHGVLDSLGLPAGDSFWLFDPSGSDMALFRHDLDHKGPHHDDLLEEIRAGRLDVMHTAGSYGPRFNMGHTLTRELVDDGLDYLAAHARVPRIWTNHESAHNRHTIAGQWPYPEFDHRGDNPDSDIYILDLLLDHGFEYFWLDRLWFSDEHAAHRVISEERCRSGQRIKCFLRFSGLATGPNGENLHRQIGPSRLDALASTGQNVVLYQHWGCRHREDGWPYTPEGCALGAESISALHNLARLHHDGVVRVQRLGDFLADEAAATLADEAQRVGSQLPAAGYQGQSIAAFQTRLQQLDVSGRAALDVGCGAGQRAFALTDAFEHVAGVDEDGAFRTVWRDMTTRLRQQSPTFVQARLDRLPYGDGAFDFVWSEQVLSIEQQREVLRVMRPGGLACLAAPGATSGSVRSAIASTVKRWIVREPAPQNHLIRKSTCAAS